MARLRQTCRQRFASEKVACKLFWHKVVPRKNQLDEVTGQMFGTYLSVTVSKYYCTNYRYNRNKRSFQKILHGLEALSGHPRAHSCNNQEAAKIQAKSRKL
ncbi:hypothetical protein Y032_0107g3806 [Ancylostoma ceylanicum]|uniref:Uncharacterized protein n=1 Tax=Ancylostoma ceylanicum TaxID=53326 RepID=A0A016TEQ0_9BILA|nr:hypothetical protein Y032_0107g3806 [Ancylostoma ceylanicum]